jgi:D-glycero-D-manno-heptose 1,7-bisphosphate phosphatase
MIKIVFLDRDGVINKYPGDKSYVTSAKNFRFLPRVKDALKLLSDAGFMIFIVSNQAGVGKGLYSQKKLDEITSKMIFALVRSGVNISGVYYCIHKPDDNCTCRKPNIGLIKKALHDFMIKNGNLRKEYFIGDSQIDIKTAIKAGLKSILVLSGKEKLSNRSNWEVQPNFIAKDLLSAVKIVLKGKER